MSHGLHTIQEISYSIMARVPGCPIPVIEQAVRDTIGEVCERTLVDKKPIYKEIYGSVISTGGLVDDSFLVSLNTVLLRITKEGSSTSTKLIPISSERLYEIYPGWDITNIRMVGPPVYIYESGSYIHEHGIRNLHLVPGFIFVPGEAAYLVGTGNFKPNTTNLTSINLYLYLKIKDVIPHGVLQKLLTMQGKTWTNLELASYHARQFTYKIADKRAQTNITSTPISLKVQPVPFM